MALLVALPLTAAVPAGAVPASAHGPDRGRHVEHVLLLSVDGLHQQAHPGAARAGGLSDAVAEET